MLYIYFNDDPESYLTLLVLFTLRDLRSMLPSNNGIPGVTAGGEGVLAVGLTCMLDNVYPYTVKPVNEGHPRD